jgi:hypothetical protein
MIREKQQAISMQIYVREWTCILLFNTPCSHLHRFCAAGTSMGLATKLTSTRVWRGRTCFWFFMSYYVIVVGLRFELYFLHYVIEGMASYLAQSSCWCLFDMKCVYVSASTTAASPSRGAPARVTCTFRFVPDWMVGEFRDRIIKC